MNAKIFDLETSSVIFNGTLESAIKFLKSVNPITFIKYKIDTKQEVSCIACKALKNFLTLTEKENA